MRFVQAAFVLVAQALLLVAFFNDADQRALILLLSLAVVVEVLVLVDAVVKVRRRKTAALGTGAMIVKLTAMPVFVLNFLVAATFSGFFAAGAALIVLAFVADVVLLLATSVYAVAALIALRRDRLIGTGLTVLYAVMLVFFITDVVAGIMLFVHSRGAVRRQVPAVPAMAG